ncbi:MAG: RHS repeat-associated core domain-containing protein [bacterium]
MAYRYNGQGERSARIEAGVEQLIATSFGEQTHVRTAAGQTTRRYVYGDQSDQVLAVDQPDGPVYFALDGRGSVAAAFNQAGQLVGRYLYDDFGALLDRAGAFVSPVGFEGRPVDPTTGLYDFRARTYDPGAGRFLQQDPESGSLQRPITQHPDVYGANSPWFYRDPNGRAAAISYAFLTSRFVTGSGNVNSPSHGELLGAFIGFMHGFSAGALVFLANILDLSGSNQDIKTIWGIAASRTKDKLNEIAGLLGRGAALDDTGFAGAFVNGAKFQVGFKFSLKLPKPVSKGIAVAGGKTSKSFWLIEKSGGGFKEGNKQFLNYLDQLAPQ